MNRMIHSISDLATGTAAVGQVPHFANGSWRLLATRHINVKAYDAAGDGVTDDTAEIVAALTAAQTAGLPLYFPPGIYLVSSTLTIPYRVDLIGTGAQFNEGTDTSSLLRSTIKLANGSNCDLLINDPTGPERGGQDVPHFWQRSFISNLQFNANGANQTGTRHGLHFTLCWGITLHNVEVFNARGINIFLDDVNGVDGHNVATNGASLVTTSQLKFYKSADCNWTGFQGHASKGPNILFDESIYNNLSFRGGYTIDATTNDEYGLSFINTSMWNLVKGVIDKPYLDGVYLDATSKANSVEVTVSEVGYANASGRSAFRIAGSGNAISGSSRPLGGGSENDLSGVVIEANANENDFSGLAISGYTTNWDISATGTGGNIIPGGDSVFLPANELYTTTATPALGLVGGGRYPAWLLDAATNEGVGGTVSAPRGWTRAKATAVWVNAGAGAGDVVLSISGGSYTVGDTLAAAPNSESPVTTAGALDVVVETAPATLNNMIACTGGKTIIMRVTRSATDAADTLANDIGLLGIRLDRAA